ncbi:hypothetical protein SAMN02799630_01315 [Paenibacillus sp. UNCCL117]|uniref:hypothetical protein n=1 Tax=unclassified Paenibacillus TaxID=185978 RepID=UPI000888BB47|nr:MULTISPECIES: hypothetical protein [unclassified Paenibacillus]SDC72970.1 hypothetical protein SAMN04488602_103293 [Paenibacillus sp. cl123]SFW24912.1 hypothetical protein SAMN02799630_01315 [Paenibacillus sp. UNCCL117]
MKRRLGGHASRSSGMTRSEAALHRYKLQQLQREAGHGDGGEEFAAEAGFGALPGTVRREKASRRPKPSVSRREAESRTAAASTRVSQWSGYAALLASALALFIFPVLLGSAGMLLGAVAYGLGQRKLGAWALTVGLLALAGYFILVPFFYS